MNIGKPGPMQRVADESRQVRKEATAVSLLVCRGKPGPLCLFLQYLPEFKWVFSCVTSDRRVL